MFHVGNIWYMNETSFHSLEFGCKFAVLSMDPLMN